MRSNIILQHKNINAQTLNLLHLRSLHDVILNLQIVGKIQQRQDAFHAHRIPPPLQDIVQTPPKLKVILAILDLSQRSAEVIVHTLSVTFLLTGGGERFQTKPEVIVGGLVFVDVVEGWVIWGGRGDVPINGSEEAVNGRLGPDGVIFEDTVVEEVIVVEEEIGPVIREAETFVWGVGHLVWGTY